MESTLSFAHQLALKSNKLVKKFNSRLYSKVPNADHLLLKKEISVEVKKKLLNGWDVSLPGGARVVIKGKIELRKKIADNHMEMIDVLLRCAACDICAERDGNTILIRAANVEHFAALKPFKTGVAIGRKISSCNMPKMELPVGVRKS